MEISKSLTYIFDDDNWLKKCIIGGLILLIAGLLFWSVIALVVAGALIAGYMLELIRNVRKDVPNPLPEWHHWGDKFIDGIKLMGILFVWSIPLIIVEAPGSFLSGIFDTDNVFMAFLLLCLSCLAFLYVIFLWLATPTITIRLAETGDFSSGFEFHEIWNFTRDNVGDIIIAIIVLFLVSFVSFFVGLIICGIGLFFTMFYVVLVQGHLYGQIGRKVTPEPLSPAGPAIEDVAPAASALPETTDEGAQSEGASDASAAADDDTAE